jgi:molecular chaperone GrpE
MSEETPDQTKPTETEEKQAQDSIAFEDVGLEVKNCPQCEENIGLAKRALADYENLKKETQRWKEEFVGFANMQLIEKILPVIDNFFSAMDHIPEDQKMVDWVVGVSYIKKQLVDVLEKEGATLFGKVGDAFDPHQYEAVEEVKGEKEESGKVLWKGRP